MLEPLIAEAIERIKPGPRGREWAVLKILAAAHTGATRF